MNVLLIGKTGQVGRELQKTLASLGTVIAVDRSQMDLSDPDSICRRIREVTPEIIVNAAGYTAVDKAETEPDIAMLVNAAAPGVMAEEAKRIGALLVHYSTDYVFDGKKTIPYVETDAPHPLNVYGKSKLEGERAITTSGCAHLILRASWIYSDRGTNFVLTMLRLARERQQLAVVDDQIGSPTWARTLAETTTELLGKAGRATKEIFHLSATGCTSRYNFARKIVETARMLSGESDGWADVCPTTSANYLLPATRPLNAATSKKKLMETFGISMPHWEVQLRECLVLLVKDKNACGEMDDK